MPPPSPKPIIVWFRNDLRLSDHPALHAAAQSGQPVICLYVLDEDSAPLRPPRGRPIGSASRWWLAQSLRSLDQSLKALGTSLVLRRGDTASVIAEIARQANASAVHWIESDIAGPAAAERDVARQLGAFRATCWSALRACATRKAVACASSRHSGNAC